MPRSSEFFAAGGILSRRIPGFAYRPCQEGMAELVEKALSSSCHAVVEAGTGTGKSYAYIVPLMLRAAEGLGKEIIATSTTPNTIATVLYFISLPEPSFQGRITL